MRLRAVQPALFAIAALSFLLPFAQVSCSADPTTGTPAGPVDGEGGPPVLKGYELVVGSDLGDHLDESESLSEYSMDADAARFGAEPFAVLAFAAALVGLGVSFSPRALQRARGGVAAGGAGLLCASVLGLAPTMRSLGMAKVEWQVGYLVCLVAFLGATAVSYLEQRHAQPLRRVRSRPPPPVAPRGPSGPDPPPAG